MWSQILRFNFVYKIGSWFLHGLVLLQQLLKTFPSLCFCVLTFLTQYQGTGNKHETVFINHVKCRMNFALNKATFIEHEFINKL